MAEIDNKESAKKAPAEIKPITVDDPTLFNNGCDTDDEKSKMGIVSDNAKPIIAVKDPASVARYERDNPGEKYPFAMGQLLAMHNPDTGKVTFHGAADTGGVPDTLLDVRFGNGTLNSGIVAKDSSGNVLENETDTAGVDDDSLTSADFYVVGELSNSKGQLWPEAWAERRAAGNNAEASGYDKESSARLALAETGVQEIRDQMDARLAEFAEINNLPTNEQRLAALGEMNDKLFAQADTQLAQNLNPVPAPVVGEPEEQLLAQGGEVGSEYNKGSDAAPVDVASIPTQPEPINKTSGEIDPVYAMVNPGQVEAPTNPEGPVLAGIDPAAQEKYIAEAHKELEPETHSGIAQNIDEDYVRQGQQEAKAETLAAAAQAESEVEPETVVAAVTPKTPEEIIAQDFDIRVADMSKDEAKAFRSEVGEYAMKNTEAPSQLFDKGTIWDDVRYADAVKEGVSERLTAEGINTDVNNIAVNDAEKQNDVAELDGATKESAQLAMGSIGNLSPHIDNGTTVNEPQTGADLSDMSRNV